MKHILVIHTGGTISMKASGDSEVVSPADKNPLTAFIRSLKIPVIINEIELFNKPSPHMTLDDMLEIKQSIEEKTEKGNIDGVVITHGTDTLEETAYFLDLTLQKDLPVVLTGAMRAINEIGTDGLRNFLNALYVAASSQASGKGVLVVMNDEIHTAEKVTKTDTSNAASFKSSQSGPIGIISNRKVIFLYEVKPKKPISIEKTAKKVGLIKAFAGMDSSLLLAYKDLAYDGVVVEGLGIGNIPPDAVEGIDQLLQAGIPVVLVSRCMDGNVEPVYDYSGGSKQLKSRGVIFGGNLSGQKARIKLSIILMETNDMEEIKDYFLESTE